MTKTKKSKRVVKKTPKTTTKKVAKKTSKKSNIIKGYKSVSLKMNSWHDPRFKFKVGKEHTPTQMPIKGDTASCGIGLHFSPTAKDASFYANGRDHLLLEVQAYRADVLGKDNTKIRVAKLKVNKVFKTVLQYGPEWQAAKKEVDASLKKIFLPSKKATPQKLTDLFKAWVRGTGYKKAKTHFTDNYYEASFLSDCNIDNFSDFEDSWDGQLKWKPLPIDKFGCLDEAIEAILLGYLGAHEGDGNKLQKAIYTPLFEMLKLGSVPVGFSWQKPKTFLVYAPKTNPYILKRPF